MDKFLKIVGAVVVLWIALGLIGAIFGFLVKTVLWVALIAGAVYLVSLALGKAGNRNRVGTRR